MERTLVLLKPDAIQRGLIGKIISRFEDRGFKIAGMKLLWMNEETAEKLYEPHIGKAFYPPLVQYMTSGPIIAMVVEGFSVVDEVRTMMGATDPKIASPGSIRGDFGQRVDRNCVHGSDSLESAGREIPIFFSGEEIVSYEHLHGKWM